jgi:hypothetical protein
MTVRSSAGSVTVTVAGLVVTPLSARRTPGMACSMRFELQNCTAPSPTRNAASRSWPTLRLASNVASSVSTVPEADWTVKSESRPVLRADMTRCSPSGPLTTAATAGPPVLALIASAICCLLMPAVISTVTLALPVAFASLP